MKSLILILLLWSADVIAGTTFSCGKDKNVSARAEILFVENLDGYSLRVRGDSYSSEDFAVKPADESWIITVYGKRPGQDKKFVFSEIKKDVQEFEIPVRGREKKIGNEKECIVSEQAESNHD